MTRTVGDIMSLAPVCMAADESVSAAAEAMKKQRSALYDISAAPPNI